MEKRGVSQPGILECSSLPATRRATGSASLQGKGGRAASAHSFLGSVEERRENRLMTRGEPWGDESCPPQPRAALSGSCHSPVTRQLDPGALVATLGAPAPTPHPHPRPPRVTAVTQGFYQLGKAEKGLCGQSGAQRRRADGQTAEAWPAGRAPPPGLPPTPPCPARPAEAPSPHGALTQTVPTGPGATSGGVCGPRDGGCSWHRGGGAAMLLGARGARDAPAGVTRLQMLGHEGDPTLSEKAVKSGPCSRWTPE